MRSKAISIYLNSTGALLLALASALFIINWTSPADLVQPRDPIFLIRFDKLFSILSGIGGIVALICFFGKNIFLPAYLLLWLSVCYLVFRIGLFWNGCYGLTGYLGSFTYTFGITPGAASGISDLLFAYFFVGSFLAIWIGRRLPHPIEFQKMACPACGRRIRFPLENLGQKVECPSCEAKITLRKANEILKMSCFFCKEHIEFPAHAQGQRIKCPHCFREVGLKEEFV